MASDQWYCKIADRMIGPLTGQQIVEMARNGQLHREDEVRTSDSQWSVAGSVQGLEFSVPSTLPSGNVVSGANSVPPPLEASNAHESMQKRVETLEREQWWTNFQRDWGCLIYMVMFFAFSGLLTLYSIFGHSFQIVWNVIVFLGIAALGVFALYSFNGKGKEKK